jgi:hypothetical protein
MHINATGVFVFSKYTRYNLPPEVYSIDQQESYSPKIRFHWDFFFKGHMFALNAGIS